MTEAAQENTQPIFNIEKLYVKDLSLEIPNAPGIFLERENPQIDLQLQTQAAPLEQGLFDVTVTITVTAKLPGKEKVLFLIEAKQAGIFQIRNLPWNTWKRCWRLPAPISFIRICAKWCRTSRCAVVLHRFS